MFRIFVVLLSILVFVYGQNCKPSITTVGGTHAPSKVCAGQMILNENFNTLDKSLWQPEVTLSGGGNNEFEWYTDDDENSYAKNGKLYITPTFTADKFGEDYVENGKIDSLPGCTDEPENCRKKAGGDTIINPIRSARLNTMESFKFKYGRVEFVAKNPSGDWMWPALWLLSQDSDDKYGGWTGEIDVMESRTNRKYVTGVEQTLHFGQLFNDHHHSVSFEKTNQRGFDAGFHKYGVIWNQNGIDFFIDGQKIGSAPVKNGYWKQTGYSGKNPWAKGTKMAPFDEKYYLLINLAIGGTGGFFPDEEADETHKPWSDKSPDTAAKDFWNGRQQWQASWANKEKKSFIIDSVKVWAI